jgi:hypothetical protein
MVKARAAQYTLGAIRLIVGSVALGAPEKLVKTYGADPASNGAAVYALRLFGVRTIYIGLQLLLGEGAALDDALRAAIPIHACDTISAVIAGATGQLPRRAALTGTALSSINTVLATVANRRS